MLPSRWFRALLAMALLAASPAAAEWQPAGDRGGDFFDLRVLPDEPPVLLAVHGDGLWRLPRPDGAWEQVPVPPPQDFTDDQGFELVVSNARLVSVWVAPRDPSHLLVAFTYDVDIRAGGESISNDHYARLDESHDGGATWETVSGGYAQSLVVAPSQPDLMYVQHVPVQRHGGEPSLVRYEPGDHEQTVVTPFELDPFFVAGDVAVDAADPALVYAESATLVVSRDGGASWSEAPLEAPVGGVAAHPSIAGTALAVLGTGAVWRTTDGGDTWQPLAELPVAAASTQLDLDPVDAGRYYALAEGAVFASDDAGATWQAVPTDGLPGGAEIFDVAVDPADPSRLFASVEGEGVWLLDRRFPAAPCVPGPTTLCLGEDGRFEARVAWQDFAFNAGRGGALPLEADDTGAFWFFAEDNLELVVKALDGRPVNGFHWVFYGSLTNVPFTLVVTDTETGETIGYRNPSRHFASRGDTAAFPEGGFDGIPSPAPLTAPVESTVAASPCVPDAATLCLAGGRFEAEVAWTGPAGGSGAGTAVPATDDTGAFWFFREDNLELTVKVLDGRPVNGHWWVFYGSLTDVAFELRVTDTETGRQLLYENPLGELASRGDTSAFPAAGP